MSGSSASKSELAGAALAFLALYGVLAAPILWQDGTAPGGAAASVLLAATLAACSAIDVYFYRLPDALTLPLAAAGIFSTARAWSSISPVWGSAGRRSRPSRDCWRSRTASSW